MRRAERRFLLCTAWSPWGPPRGFQHRLAMVAETLGALGTVDVCIVNQWRSDELESDWPAWVGDAEWCRVEKSATSGARAAIGRTFSMSPITDRVAPDALAAARARFFSRHYDLTWCAEPRAYEPVAELASRPVVLDLHNVLSASLIHKRRLLVRRPWLAAAWREAINDPAYSPGIERRWRAWEAGAARACDRVVVCSDVDRTRLDGGATVVPNCYRRPLRPAGRDRDPRGPLRIGFVGFLGYQPNFDAVRWFADAILPRIRRLERDAEFHVIGESAPGLQDLGRRRGVHLHGFVPELEMGLGGLSVMVAPIRFGGGTRFKILEAFAHEIPMVSTTVGAEGIDAHDGDQLLLRDQPTAFARAVVDLHRDPALRGRLVTAASELYESQYTWERGVASVERVVHELTTPTDVARRTRCHPGADVSDVVDGGGRRAPRIACLLPVRNAAETLPGWLDEAAAFADFVVALDDGSTDDTGAILAAHPLVAAVITNERREGYLGWHDGRNRNRLLAAAAELAPDWVFSLDADEHLDPTDAERLREFVATEALPGCAYGFQLYRMHAGETYDPDYEWVYRLFAYKKTHRFRNRRLDLVPVPTDIGPERWVMTTLRVKHYGEIDELERERRVAKFREADPEGAFRDYYENLQPISPGPFPRWRPRAPEVPSLIGASDRAVASGERPHLVCLLPARDCAHLLPGWFESISRVADAVVALDDGSIDGTGDLLREHPLVVKVLTNPTRPGFADWDDGDNRNRLLAAAAELAPAWIISVDADERIPLEDAAALRRFLHDGAQPGYGYALASFRMIGDEDHYDRLDYDAYRLFAFEPGHVFPTAQLHAPPIPTAIPPDRWRQTTLRMKHLVSLTEADRSARREKFRQADPDCTWEPDYSYTIEPPGPVRPWAPRPLDLPVLVHSEQARAPADDLDLDGPVLTLVLAVEPGQERDAVLVLEEIGGYEAGEVEFLALTRDEYAAGVLRRNIGHVTVIDVEPAMSTGGARNAALYRARGDYVTFLVLGYRDAPAAIPDLIEAHEHGHAALSVRFAEPPATPAAWAEQLLTGAASHSAFISFAREPLCALGGFDDRISDEFGTAAARALLARSFTTASVSSVVRGRRAGPSAVALLQQRYEIGARGPLDAANGHTTAAWRELRSLDGALDAPRPIVAGLIVAGGAATWLGRARQRMMRSRSSQ